MKSIFIPALNIRQNIAIFLISLCSALSVHEVSAQTNSKPTRQSSIEAFSDGKFEIALAQFEKLLISYPKDPLYRYYSGVCLVKLNRDPDKAADLLKNAQSGQGLKNLPSDAMFYLARAQQMDGKFDDAIDSYRKFSEISGRKTAKDYGVPGYIQQCLNKTGNIIREKIPAVQTTEIKPEQDSSLIISPEAIIIKNPPLPPDYEKLLEEGLRLQIKADSLRGFKTTQMNLLSVRFQKEADMKFEQAEAIKPGSSLNVRVAPDDTIPEVTKPDTVIIPQAGPDTIALPLIPDRVEEIYSIFEVDDHHVYKTGEKVAIDSEVPDGLVYRIQLAVFRNPVAPSFFKGIMPVYGFKAEGKDLTVYYAGMFRRLADASKALNMTKSKGFKDSFVVSFLGKKTVSADRAASLEKEWGNKPLLTRKISNNENRRDTIPPALAFRIEVIRSEKPLDESFIDGLRKVSGNRILDILSDDKNRFVYLIGKFITFESAEEYKNLLIRNGYREAKVGAWMGKNEVPLETAKKLFETSE